MYRKISNRWLLVAGLFGPLLFAPQIYRIIILGDATAISLPTLYLSGFCQLAGLNDVIIRKSKYHIFMLSVSLIGLALMIVVTIAYQ